MLIGTFKALGYSRARIASKYLLHAAVASVTGSVLGIAVLSQVLPAVISRPTPSSTSCHTGRCPSTWARGVGGRSAWA